MLLKEMFNYIPEEYLDFRNQDVENLPASLINELREKQYDVNLMFEVRKDEIFNNFDKDIIVTTFSNPGYEDEDGLVGVYTSVEDLIRGIHKHYHHHIEDGELCFSRYELKNNLTVKVRLLDSSDPYVHYTFFSSTDIYLETLISKLNSF